MTATEPAPSLATVPPAEAQGSTARWSALRDVPLRLSIDIPLPAMSLRALGALHPGQVLASVIATADDLTVVIGGAPVGLARFEYMDGRMSIRITRLLGTGSNTTAAAGHGAVPAAAVGGTGA